MLYEMVFDNGINFFARSNASRSIMHLYMREYMVRGGIQPDSEVMRNIFENSGYSYKYEPLLQVDIYNVIKNRDYVVIYLGDD